MNYELRLDKTERQRNNKTKRQSTRFRKHPDDVGWNKMNYQDRKREVGRGGRQDEKWHEYSLKFCLENEKSVLVLVTMISHWAKQFASHIDQKNWHCNVGAPHSKKEVKKGTNKYTFVKKTSQELRMLSRSLSDCKSLAHNVMIEVSQFVSSSQLCH